MPVSFDETRHCSTTEPKRGESFLCGRFPFTNIFGKCLPGISVCEVRVPFATSSIRGSQRRLGRLKDRERYGTGDKNNKAEKSVNETQIFHWEVSTGKTGLPFQKFHLFRKFRNQKIVFHLHLKQNFWKFFVSSRSSIAYKRPPWLLDSISCAKKTLFLPLLT